MHATVVQPSPAIGYAISLAVIALVVALRWRGMRRARRLRLETLWILPAVYVVGIAVLFAERPPTPIGWGWCVVTLAIGAGIGWQRGRMMRIAIDPETHRLSQQSSPAAFLILIALLAVKQGMRYEFGGGQMAALGIDMALSFGLGLIAATRLEMTLRARRMLGAARAGY
jgi:hypothetical protein